jgi:hypothetical protein
MYKSMLTWNFAFRLFRFGSWLLSAMEDIVCLIQFMNIMLMSIAMPASMSVPCVLAYCNVGDYPNKYH